MGDSQESHDGVGGGPISDSELDAIVAEIYLSGSAAPDPAQLDFMRQRFRSLYGTKGVVEQFPFAAATIARPEKTYNRNPFEELVIRLYKTRLDRAAGLVLATATVCVGMLTLVGIITMSTTVALAYLTVMVGVLLGAGVFESGRLGYLSRLNWNHIDDLGASLPALVVRGHHRVHEEELAMLRRARFGSPLKLLVIKLWNRQRRTGTDQSSTVDRELDLLVDEHPDCDVRSAVSATPETWESRSDLLQRRFGKVDQRFFLENPLQVDAILTDDEAILSFPRGRGDRGLAILFRSQGIVQELWEVFESQVGKGTTATSVSIDTNEDIQTVKNLVHDPDRSMSRFPPISA